MPLTENQIGILRNAITAYNFPCVYYDFENGCEVSHLTMSPVEEALKNDLISRNSYNVKNGLSNVLYWGFAQVGYRDTRVKTFRSKVRDGQLHDASILFKDQENIDLMKIKNINMPQFSGMSFISKVAMFLNPKKYVILDKQILKMNQIPLPTLLNEIAFGDRETRIRISRNNIRIYLRWCLGCSRISQDYFDNIYRAVDIERGFFTLIQNGNVNQAAKILSNA